MEEPTAIAFEGQQEEPQLTPGTAEEQEQLVTSLEPARVAAVGSSCFSECFEETWPSLQDIEVSFELL